MADEQAWREYWAGGEGGEAVGGAQRHKLAAHWAAVFSEARGELDPSALIVDIAAGRGVALKAAIEALARSGAFLAVDYSPAAALSVRRDLPRAFGAAADAACLPLPNRCAAAVISQFGIEYAGIPAFAEAARIVAPKGRFCAIAHYRGGAIDAECAGNERLIGVGAGPALFRAARESLAETYRRRDRGDPTPGDRSRDQALATGLAGAAAAVRSAPPSAAKATLERFLGDLSRLSARRLAYEATDALGWLGGMEASLDAYLKRMQSMRAAALDRAAIEQIHALFLENGLEDFRAEPLMLDAERLPAAWVIKARRPL